jgi:hypothetical protein
MLRIGNVCRLHTPVEPMTIRLTIHARRFDVAQLFMVRALSLSADVARFTTSLA